MYLSPQKAKRLYFDVIPKCVDEYLSFLKAYHDQDEAKRLDNPVYHVHNGNVPKAESSLSYSLLLNLVSACNSDDVSVLWGYVKKFEPNASPQNTPILAGLIENAMNYYHDFVKPHKQFRAPSEEERKALLILAERLAGLAEGAPAEEIQNLIYTVGKDNGFDIKLWFSTLYQVLLGAEQGPRFGSFVALYGAQATVKLIEEKCM
jgi:lysyl-tRNA synthetase class 1